MPALDAIVAHHTDDEDRAHLRAVILANARRRFARYDAALAERTAAQEAIDFQLCYSCGQLKPVEDFNRDRSKPTGRKASCKECYRASVPARSQTS